MTPNLPGFYYDRERRRYFRISENQSISTTGTTNQYRKDNIKRQCVEENYDKKFSMIKKKRQQTLQKYKLSLLNPLERAFRPLSYEKYMIGLNMQYASHSLTEGHHSHSSANVKSLNFPHRIQIGSEPTDVFKTMKLERTVAIEEGPSHYFYHNVNTRSNVHTFAIFIQDFSSLKLLKIRQVKLKENCQVHDSLVVGDTLIITVNYRCHFYDLIPETFPNPYIFSPAKSSRKHKSRSDITSLSFCLQEDALSPLKKTNTGVFYLGYRNGDSMAIVFTNITNMTLQYSKTNGMASESRNQPIRNSPKSVVSIKALNNKGLMLISGMADKEDVQQLVIADTFLEDILTEIPVVSFKTKFLNVTKDTEILEISDDGRYFIYGSTSARDGKGDFEVFCTTLSGNLDYEKSEGGNITLYPIGGMKNYCRLENFQFESIHLHSAFIPPRYVKLFDAVEPLGEESSTSPYDIPEEGLPKKYAS
ncbi:ANL_collapsed_G0018390.mRNA.1.CDS.1 [Saccharomyces cerevisiae]|nr:ANL_collapsed_G0018390.mRNA.1.CDS.1 [Saccharomyces cerevisiae]